MVERKSTKPDPLPSISELRVLRELGRGLSSSKTAEVLGMDGSTVSAIINTRLPMRFSSENAPVLTELSGKTTKLTRVGALLAAAADEVLARLERARADVIAAQGGYEQQLSIAFIPAAMSALQRVLPELRQRIRTPLRIELREAFAQEQERALRSGVVDVALGYRISPFLQGELSAESFEVREVARLPLMIVVPEAEAERIAADPPSLSGRTLWGLSYEREPQLVRRVSLALEALGITPRVRSIDSARAQLAYVGSGDGFCVLPESLARLGWPGVRALELPGFQLAVPLCAIYRRGESNACIAQLVSLLELPATPS